MKCKNCNKNEAEMILEINTVIKDITYPDILTTIPLQRCYYSEVLCQGCYNVIQLLVSAFSETIKQIMKITDEGINQNEKQK